MCNNVVGKLSHWVNLLPKASKYVRGPFALWQKDHTVDRMTM